MMVTLGMGEVFTVCFVADEVVGVRGSSSGVLVVGDLEGGADANV